MSAALKTHPSIPRPALARTHLPRSEDFLLWSPCLQSYGYRIVDQLFATRVIQRGQDIRPTPRGDELELDYEHQGQPRSVEAFMDRNSVAGLLVIRDGEVVLERYGLGLRPGERWSTMSTVKSMTAILVGAAIRDGAIDDIDDPVVRYLPQLRDSGYAKVTVRQLMTMSSGVGWTEDYTDRASDVNRYSKSLADKVPGGVLRMLQAVPGLHAPGTRWHYNTGDTYLLGCVLCAATKRSLSEYMSDTIWKPCGMQDDAFYTLESEDGQEIAGSRAGMSLRDMGRFAWLIASDGVMDGQQVLPAGWVEKVAERAFDIPRDFHPSRLSLGLTGYGFGWWLTDDGAMMAMGHSGQRIYVNRAEKLALVNLAVYPEPRYVNAQEHDRDAELHSFIRACR
ncbi:serine hydrolase domain-containing protein [Variovorax robiniae]|uniref:Serine hydrolase domain-containing protein n=1 Tax=Variovorax robiniae TaxID=1836199 RepID=A0ABU8XDB6_9BURK